MIFQLLLLIVAILLVKLIHKKGRANEDFFKGTSVKHTKPAFIFGHSGRMWAKKEHPWSFVRRIYDEFPSAKAVGFWDLRTPVVMIRDPQLVKHFTVKNVDSFTNHRVVIDEEMDSWFGNALGALTDQKWRDMRATLSPAFTGSKMRSMFQLITEVSGQFVRHLRKESENKSVLGFDMKDLCSRYTNDVIALCAFGIEVDTLENKDNEFYTMGKSVMDFTRLANILKLIVIRFLPLVAKQFKIELLGPKQKRFFGKMVLEMMDYRQKNNVVRPDMINLIIDAKRGTSMKNIEKEIENQNHSAGFATVEESDIGKQTSKRAWTDDELIAQCVVFFLAGFDTSSTAMTMATYELVANPEVQEKLFREIQEVDEGLQGKAVSYEVLQGMKYLDMVVSETLRKWPPAPTTDRVCTKSFDYKDEETGLELHFKKGDNIWIPINALHHDAKYFPESDKFLPERFSEENRHAINANAYLPFGSGSRACIASRFALMEVKALLYQLVLNFELLAVETTRIPYTINNDFGSLAKNVFVGLKLR